MREPITVILSRARLDPRRQGPRSRTPRELKFKEGDKLAFLVPAETTDKLLIFASDGRFFTLACDKLPGARGHGEPLRLMIDLDDRVGIVDVFVHKPGRQARAGLHGGLRLHPAGGGGHRLPPRRQAGAERRPEGR